jgi:hypothetical protein
MPNRLYLLGLGVEPAEHGTIEVLQAAGQCDVVFCDGLDAAQRRDLSRYCARGEVSPLDARAGESAAAKKILAARAAGKTVGFATLGHPFYWSALGGRLAVAAAKKGVEWRTFGAVSPMGLALSVSGVTLGTNVHGMQAFDARSLAEKAAVVNLAWPTVVYFYLPLDAAAYARVVARLSREFGDAHPALWCSAGAEGKAGRVGDLAGAFGELRPGRVLFLERKVISKSVLGRTDNHPMKRDDKKAPSWVKQ